MSLEPRLRNCALTNEMINYIDSLQQSNHNLITTEQTLIGSTANLHAQGIWSASADCSLVSLAKMIQSDQPGHQLVFLSNNEAPGNRVIIGGEQFYLDHNPKIILCDICHTYNSLIH